MRIGIIGAGPGGYVCAIRAAQLEAEVFLIEEDKIGGTCLNKGCIPTKTYFKNAEILNELKRSEDFGISVENYSMSMAKLYERKENVVATLVTGIEQILSSYKNIKVIKGKGKILNGNSIEVETADEKYELNVDKIVIATGSKTFIPKIEGVDGERVLTSTELLELKEVPKSMVIVGGGVIGLEFASIFSEFGTDITIFTEEILLNADGEMKKRLSVLLKKQGIKIVTDVRVEKFETKDGVVTVSAKSLKKEKIHTAEGEYALVAIGRSPNLEGFGLENLNLNTTKKGIAVDENYECSVKGVYAIGDVNGISQLAHAASFQGECVAEHIMGVTKKRNKDIVPACVFTLTELSQVGATEEELKEKGTQYIVSKFNFAANGKSLSLGNKDGFVKVLASKDGKILGVHILGPHANDLIEEAAICMANDLTVEDVTATIHPHPTLSESFSEACAGVLGEGIHTLNLNRQ